MLNIDGIIRKREIVTPGAQIVATVKQLYNKDVIEQTILEKITYISGGLNISGYIARPRERGSFPVLIWNRGGNEEKGALDDLRAYLILASTAAWGYVVLATQYRGNMGSDGVEDWGGEDLTDALNMIEVAKNLPECDTEKIAVEGASRGGMTTYRALLEYGGFKCAIVHAGIADVPALVRTRPGFEKFISDRYSELTDAERIEELKKISAVHFAERLPKNIPILIMHGTEDAVVPVSQSQALADELKKHNVPHKLILLDGGTHVAFKDGSYKEIDRHRKEWLEKYLI